MSLLQEYKCPCCGGAVEFSSEVQKMKCPYCETEFELESLKAYDEILKDDIEEDFSWETQAGSDWAEGEEDKLRIFVCKSCGGEIVGDENTGATKCPYCDSPVVMMGSFSGDKRPDLVIPFKLDKEDAKKNYLKHISKKKLLPKVFKDQNHIDEIKGVYVPFWLFDANAGGNVRYKGTKVRMWSDSNYDYTDTSFYSVQRGGNVGFKFVPVDGSSKMADDLMESVEPFDINEAVDFQTAYLSGYLADKYDVTAEESIDRANNRIRKSTADAFASTVVGYTTLTPESTNIELSDGKSKYALYPVWILNTTYKDQKYVFAMNGQTGKFVGDLPVDKGLSFKWWGIYTGIIGAIAFIIANLIWFL